MINQRSNLFRMQREIASRVVLRDGYSIKVVSGVDQAFLGELIISGAVSLNPAGEIIDRAYSFSHASFPYIPGLLSFREGPAAIAALSKLQVEPTLIFADGCGINHPRMAGLASFIGVVLDLPIIGVSKNILCGIGQIPEEQGHATDLVFNGMHVGYLLKSKLGCRPIIIAPGHRISLEASLRLTRMYLTGHKLPLPIVMAHQYANQIKKALQRNCPQIVDWQAQLPEASSSAPIPSGILPDCFWRALDGMV